MKKIQIIKLILLSLLLCRAVDNYATKAHSRTAAQAEALSNDKVSVHIDSITYSEGEVIWYSARVLYADSLHTSRVLYVDLLSQDGILLGQQKLPITDNQCRGSFVLAKKVSLTQRDVNILFPKGSYQLRAYTAQMVKGNNEGSEMDGLVLDGWVVNRRERPLEGVTVTAVIDAEEGSEREEVKVKTDHRGYWCLPMEDFFGTRRVSLSLDRKRRHGRRIVVRQSLYHDLSSQLAAYGAKRKGGSVSNGAIQCFDMLDEENTRLNLGLKSISVAGFLSEKTFKTNVSYKEVSYSPNQPTTDRQFYSEVDYGIIDPQRLDQADALKFSRPVPASETRTYVNGHLARWNINVPKDFPSKIYDKAITYKYTREIDIKYVRSILLIDYEPATHPYVTVSVVMRHAEELGNNDSNQRTILFAGYNSLVELYASSHPDGPMADDKVNSRSINWDSENNTNSAGYTTLTFHIGDHLAPSPSASSN